LTFENNCLEGKMTFGEPFEDSGVVAFCLGKPSKMIFMMANDYTNALL